MQATAPWLWDLLELLMSATKVGGRKVEHETEMNTRVLNDGGDSEYWDHFADLDLKGIIEKIVDDLGACVHRNIARQEAIIQVISPSLCVHEMTYRYSCSWQKQVVVIGIVMQSTSQKVNALESIIGIFLHSCKTPKTVIETLMRMGISISINAIHQAITSLSAKSAKVLRDLGQTLLTFYAYDNFDVDLKLSIHTTEKSEDTLKHLTSAIVFPFQHGVTWEDMRCSEELWSQSRLNTRVNISDLPVGSTWKDLFTLHPEGNHPSGLTWHTYFNSWKFLWNLCHHGPNYFAQFRANIGDAEVIEQIPVVKTPTIPARTMEFSNSMVSRNISTVKNLAEQGGVGDPNDPEIQDKVVDITPYVVLFHGDLGTGDRLLSIQSHRAIKKSAWN